MKFVLQQIWQQFLDIGADVSNKLHFLYNHLHHFPEYFGDSESMSKGRAFIRMSLTWKYGTKGARTLPC